MHFPDRGSMCVSTRWPLRLTADGLLQSFTRASWTPIIVGAGRFADDDDTITNPSEALRELFTAVADCWGRVIAVIDRGELEVFDWEGHKIEPRMLRSPKVLIDLATGDLFEEGKDDPLRKEPGLSLAAVSAAESAADISAGRVENVIPLARPRLSKNLSRPRRKKRGKRAVVLDRVMVAMGRGHTVRLMPPAYVKPYVRRQKNDAAHLLFDEARILDGERPADARMFCDRLARVLRRGLGKISA